MRARLFLVITTALATAVAGNLAGAATTGRPIAAAVERLQTEYGPEARVEINPALGTARLVVLPVDAAAKAAASPHQAVMAFIAAHGDLFGIADPAIELLADKVARDRIGWSHLTYHQQVDGVPVFAATLKAHFDSADRLRSLNGFVAPTPATVPIRPQIAAATAMAQALDVARKGSDSGALRIGDSRLVLYHTGIVRGVPGELRLAWEIEIRDDDVARERTLVDARDGRILDRFELIHDITRVVGAGPTREVVWREGDPLPYSGSGAVADAEINTIIAASKNTYDLFANLSGGSFLSYDSHDAPMLSLYDPPSTVVQCPNANANGSSTAFCPGFGVDDVVGHEWTHNYTGATHGLIYQWQPGALNESYSDIFGEVVDQLNGLGTDAPASLRSAGACSDFGGSAPTEATVLAPASLAGPLRIADAEFNPRPPWTVEAELAAIDDGIGVAADGCEPAVGFPAGRIALVDRGSCEFKFKTATAEAAGAVGVVIVNLQDDFPIQMGSGSTGGPVTIPAVSVGRSDGQRLRDALADGVVIRMARSGTSESSVRWLIGEDNGALRDMWTPSCAGDPTRVGDPRYECSDNDSGGVHTNSGIPNHAFALLVDGGTFNGHTVGAIGLTKAAHVYWRAMSVYQTPTTGFADHAALLELSCRDLIGADLTDLGTGAVAADHITAADCDQITAATSATEMELAPDQCGFLPLLQPDAPDLSGAVTVFEERFDSDPGPAWTRTNQGVYPEYVARDWLWTTDVPVGGDGGALFAVDDPRLGNCQPFDNDQSGLMRVVSPAIELPNRIGRLLVILDHYVASEPGYDGGNIWLSVNGGDFRQIPSPAFTFNPYNARLQSAGAGNTNPLAGQDGFTGTDGGVPSGSWGQSQIDLAGLAAPGDSIRLRFDFGVDGCTGYDGWYLDRIAVELVPYAPRRGGRFVSGP